MYPYEHAEILERDLCRGVLKMSYSNIAIRHEIPADYRAVEELTREAFWGSMTHPACDGEHLIVHKLRKQPSFVPALDFVAEIDGVIVGHIIYSLAKVVMPTGQEIEVLTFGPISVMPQYKRMGIGSALMRHSIAEAKRLGYRAIVFYGHPDYYPRFGFQRASRFNITAPDGSSFDALMAMELFDGALDNVSGKFFEDSIFHIDPKEVEDFDKTFPAKEPVVLPPIEVITERLSPVVAAVMRQKGIRVLAKLQEFSGSEIMSWEGVDSQAMETINHVLTEYGYSPKLLPSSYIIQLGHETHFI